MKTFEDKLKRLEDLCSKIKDSDIFLEDALSYFEEGMKLSKELEKQLDSAQAKIQILVNADEITPKKQTKRTKKSSSDAPKLDLFQTD